ncbi:MAG: hypothetical protein ACYSTT_22325 [Planctomycetota bacterium]
MNEIVSVNWRYSRAKKKNNESTEMKHILSIIIVLVIIYIVPFALYALSTVVWNLKPPDDIDPWRFLLSILVSKTGTAIAFVVLYHYAKAGLHRRWLLYAFIWWLSFTIGEFGQAIGPNYTWKEAVVGIISEAIYFPLAAVVIDRIIGAKPEAEEE